MPVTEEELRQIGIFSDPVSSLAVRHVASTAHRRQFKPGDSIFTQHSSTDVFYLVKQGVVHGFRNDSEDLHRYLYWRYPGEQLGLAPCLSAGEGAGLRIAAAHRTFARHDSSAHPHTTCDLIEIRRGDMLMAMQLCGVLISNVVLSLSQRFHQHAERQEWLHASAAHSLAAFFYEWDRATFVHNETVSRGSGRNAEIVTELHTSRIQLAEWLSMNRDTVAKGLNELASAGLIEKKDIGDRKTSCIVLDSDGLKTKYLPTLIMPSGL